MPSETPFVEPVAYTSGARRVACDEVPVGVIEPEPGSLECRAVYVEEDYPIWSVTLPGPCEAHAVAPDLAMFVACVTPDGFDIHGLDPAGDRLPGWPIGLSGRLPSLRWNDFEYGCGHGSPPMIGSSDGILYIALSDASASRLHAFDRDGLPIGGWPVAFPGDAGVDCAGFLVASDGSVRMWGFEDIASEDEWGLTFFPFARRSVFVSLDRGGRTLPGWPVGSTGTASGPLVGTDGTMYYVSHTAKVWAHDARGTVVSGWPYQLPEQVRPHLTADGRLVFLIGQSVLALTNRGTAAPGWPVDLPAARASLCFEGDVDCYGFVHPAFARDGTIYLALNPASHGGSRVVAFDPRGAMVAGWPYVLAEGMFATELAVDHRGNVHVTACRIGACGPESEVISITSAGESVY